MADRRKYGDIVADLMPLYDFSGTPSDDSSISFREIIADYHKFRSLFVHRDLKTNISRVHKDLYQTLPCLELERASVSDCPCVPPSACVWKRTVLEVPTPIDKFLKVTSAGNTLEQIRNYQYIDWDSFYLVQHSPFKEEREAAYYTVKNRRIYLIMGEKDHEQFLSVTAVFDNPIAVHRMPNCEGDVDLCTADVDIEVIVDPARFTEIVTAIQSAQAQKRGALPVMDDQNDDKAAKPGQ